MMDNKFRRFCKLYTIILLTVIVEATSNNSNDASPERRQSRVTGRIVKLYSGTRPEPILCAGEGFQADSHDCAVFYRCMKSGSGKYTVFKFQCGPGTVYDPETEVCNHPHNTKRSECGGLSPQPSAEVDRLNNNEIEGTQNEIPSPITSKPVRIESTTGAKTTFTTLNPWLAPSSTIPVHTSTKRQIPEVSTAFTSPFPWRSTTSSNVGFTVNPFNLPQNLVNKNQQYTMVSKTTSMPTTSAIPQSNSRDNICSSDGFMGDSENCRKFYRCVGNQRGTYTRFEFSCSETTVWDDDTQSCNHAWAVKRSRCGRSNQDNQFTTNAEIPQKASLTDKTIQQQLQISYGSKVTQIQTQISNRSSVIQNQTQINFGDRLNQNKDTKAKQNQTQISHGSAVSQTQTQIDHSDKGVQTQLQIDHSQQASQTQIQIHESTTSRPLTSISSSTSHDNTQTGNKCERSGFMGDSNDCKKFYRCIDNGRGGYTKFEFSCGEGTVWDQSIEACNHAWAVKDCGGKGSAETTSTTQAAISTSHSTQNYYTTISNENHHTTSELIDTEDNEDSGYGHQNQNPTTSSSTTLSSTTASFTTEKSPSNGNCQSSGFMGDANDCKIFYRCVENGKGSFTKYEFKCGEGTVWDPDIDACNHAWAVKRCGGNAPPDINSVETTTGQQNMHSTAHPQSTVKVVTQSPTATQNDDYDTGYGSANNDVISSTTTTTKKPQNEGPSVGTICTSSGFMGDENDCKKFYRCVDNGNGGYTRYEFTCGEGTVWDSKIEACNHAWAVEKCGGSTVDHQEVTTPGKPTTSHEIITSSTTEGDINTSTTSIISTVTESVSMSSNECTKSGFMADKKDCKKFYRCVDNGQGSFTKYEFSCGEGTVWDKKIEACNHAWAVEKCGGTADSSISHHETTTQLHPTMSDEIDIGYPSNIDSGSEITTQSTTTHFTSESSKVPIEGNNCISSGFIGDKNDCKKFYRCVDDGNGKYTRYEFSCGEGTLWDQSIEACNHAWAVKDCGKTGNDTVHPSSESPTQGTLSTETEDQAYPQSTEKTSTSTISSYPDSEPSEVCSKEGFIGDIRNCKKFYRCVDNGRGGFTKYEFTCGEGTYWNQEILSCDHATSNKTCGEKENSSSTQTSQPEHDEIYTEPTNMSSSSTEGNVSDQTHRPPASSGICTSEGFYGDQNDCKKFYRCVDNGKGGYTKFDFTCGDGTVWDREIQACNHESSDKKCSAGSPQTTQTTENQPDAGNDISMTTASQIQHTTEKTETSSTSTSSSNQCSSEGFFADPNDCKNFIRCVSNEKGGYTKYEFTCGEGTIWVQDILACDHDTGDAICSTQATSKPLTEGHHQTTEKNEVGTSTLEPQTIDKQEDEYDNENSIKPSQPGSDDCSSEGFYGNKNDCRQFYRCVDNAQGGFTKYDFTCGDGTAWDSEIQACNHIDQVKTCNGASETQPIMHDEDNSPSTESSSTTSSEITSSGTTTSGTTTTSATSSSTAASGSNNQDTTTGNKDKCDSEGYFGNTQDCKKFYRCVDNGKGGYTKYDFDCGEGTIWDQDVTTCNHPQDVVNPSCDQNQDGSITSTTAASSNGESPATSESTSSSGEFSSTSESSLSSDASSTTSSSSSSQSTTESTQGSSNCSQEETSKKPTNQNITCDKAGYFANPNDCKKFYRCVDWDGDGKRFSVYHFDCGEGTIWDPAVETCNHEESVYPPRDCSGSQSQSENQPATEGTTTAKQETTSTQENTSTQTTSTTESSTEQTTLSTTSEPTTTQLSTSSEKTTTQEYTTSEQTTTQKSTTSEQTTQQSTTSEQTTQQSTTSEQTTQQSTTSDQTTQKPTSEQTTTQQSTTSEQTTTQQSTNSEQTTTQQSTTSDQSTTSEQTTTEQSTTSEQTTTQQSTTSEQTTQEPTTSEQTTQTSTTTEQSTTSEPTTTEQSTTSESTTEQSTSTSESSTTQQSTTQQSTTTEQSTTEESTTSEGTTTEQSTTEQSTTEQTDESSTTESGTVESTSENKCPETDENQSLFVCPTSFKRHPKYCNMFYQCDEDDDTHDVKIALFTCPNNTIYDESQTRCVEESKADKKCDGKIAQKRRFKRLDKNYKEPLVVTKESHACPSAGYFSFEKDSECSPAFLKCKTDKTNKLRGLVYRCPSGYLYWSISKRCEPINKVGDCKRSQNNWTERWEIPVERRNVAPA